MSKHDSFEDRTALWITRNPLAYGLLVERSKAHAAQRETFSIRQLCEKLRWEKQHGILKGSESYAIPNEITRYVGIAIMRAHPETEPYMTTKLPSDDEETKGNTPKSNERKRLERCAIQKLKDMGEAELRNFVEAPTEQHSDFLEDEDLFSFYGGAE